MELREYQEFAIENVKQEFAKGNKRVLLVAPTGSGKTVIASRMIEKTEQKEKLVYLLHIEEN